MQETPHSDQLKRGAAISSERQAAVSDIKPCSLLDHGGYVGHLPRPSEEQIENWVQFVSQAHSWYKHLPLLPPGQPFHFFIDPFSGYDRIIQPGGSVINRERTEDSFQFHYTWMTTREYRRRFGHLAYESGAGSNSLSSQEVRRASMLTSLISTPMLVHGTYLPKSQKPGW